jgi:hypothetical protein
MNKNIKHRLSLEVTLQRNCFARNRHWKAFNLLINSVLTTYNVCIATNKRATSFIIIIYVQHSPSWGANRSSARQGIPHTLRKPEALYRIQKSPPPVPILNQFNPVYASVSAAWKSNLILSFHLCLGLPSFFLPWASLPKAVMHLYSLHAYYMPSPSHSPWFDHPNNIWRGAYFIKLVVII